MSTSGVGIRRLRRRGWLMVDKTSNGTGGADMQKFALPRADNVHWQSVEIDKSARRKINGHGSAVVWLTGLSGAGKTSLANELEKRLHALGKHTYTLDGDNVRHGLNRDLGFDPADRVENVRRIAEVAKLMVDAGVIVLVAAISPSRTGREVARHLLDPNEFVEVFVDTPLAVAEARDSKGLYKKARAGKLKNFTGIDSPYEAPLAPEIHIDTMQVSLEDAADKIFQQLRAMRLLDPP